VRHFYREPGLAVAGRRQHETGLLEHAGKPARDWSEGDDYGPVGSRGPLEISFRDTGSGTLRPSLWKKLSEPVFPKKNKKNRIVKASTGSGLAIALPDRVQGPRSQNIGCSPQTARAGVHSGECACARRDGRGRCFRNPPKNRSGGFFFSWLAFCGATSAQLMEP